MKQYTRHVNTVSTPQAQPIPGLESRMVLNEAGGYVFPIDNWVKLDRFLILGTEHNAYYANSKDLTTKNVQALAECVKEDGLRVVNRIVQISDQGRAVKNTPAIFALAYAAKKGNDLTRAAALAAVPQVCRIGTHLYEFAEAVESFGGWGRGTRRAVGNWFLRDVSDVAYQVIKYRQRNEWSADALLRIAHPTPTTAAQAMLLDWIVDGPKFDLRNKREKIGPYLRDIYAMNAKPEELRILQGYEGIQEATTGTAAAHWIRTYNLPREAVPTPLLNDPLVWEALLERMPVTAMLRNLGNLSKHGLLQPFSASTAHVVGVLGDKERLRKARIHPMAIFLALKVYAAGRGIRGDGTWTPVPAVIDALNDAFYESFQFVTPSNKRLLVSIDVSGSMYGTSVMGIPDFNCVEAATAMAFVMLKTEPNVVMSAFDTQYHPVALSKAQRLDDAVRMVQGAGGGGTDCAVPIKWATQKGVDLDAFVLYTDTESWYGTPHPIQALWAYRRMMHGTPAKLISAALVAYTQGDIVSPIDDAGTLGIVGFDPNVPALIRDFVIH